MLFQRQCSFILLCIFYAFYNGIRPFSPRLNCKKICRFKVEIYYYHYYDFKRLSDLQDFGKNDKKQVKTGSSYNWKLIALN